MDADPPDSVMGTLRAIAAAADRISPSGAAGTAGRDELDLGVVEILTAEPLPSKTLRRSWYGMRFEINAKCKRGLRIIRELPDFEVSRIEGYNGIGKSSALRLLELCTGSQPFQGQDKPWASFRNQLAHADVRVTDLQCGARELGELQPGWA